MYIGEHRIHLALGVILVLGVLLDEMLVLDAFSQGVPVGNNLSVETDRCQSTSLPAAPPCYSCTYQVVNSFPHDPEAFTQGLVFDNGTLLEGTGLYGRSTLRQVDMETGVVLRSLSLSSQYFVLRRRHNHL